MKFKYYALFACAFMFVVGLYLYSLDSASYTYILPFSTAGITLPVAAWVIAIVAVFFVATLLFFASAWAKDMLDSYHSRNDYDKLLSQINEQALNQPIKDRVYKNKKMSDLSKILQRFYLKPRLDSMESFNRKIDALFETYKDVMSGKVVELKNYRLSTDNKFNIQNLKNKINANYKAGFALLNDAYPLELKRAAACEILKNGEPKEIGKLLQILFEQGELLDKPLAHALFDLYVKNQSAIEQSAMIKAMAQVGFEPMEYILCAKQSKGAFSPDEWIAFYEQCADNDERAELAYFYVLFELEMIERARERHRLHAKGEYKLISAYLELKSSGKNYPFDIFVLP